jgi:hypothetical protein
MRFIATPFARRPSCGGGFLEKEATGDGRVSRYKPRRLALIAGRSSLPREFETFLGQ